MQLHPTPLFPHLCFSSFLFIRPCLEILFDFIIYLPFLSRCVRGVCCRTHYKGKKTKKKTVSALCRHCTPLLRCVWMCASRQKRHVVVLVCLSTRTRMSYCFHKRSKACAPVSPECAMGPTFCLLTHISQSLGDSNCVTVREEEMLNNWEIKCLKRLYCDKMPPANSISHSALCLPRCPSLVIAELGSALHQQRAINYTRLQDKISPKPC